jgi:predicted HTH domain antitoxin
MNVAIELPEDIARQLQAAWPDVPRRTLKAIAVEGYRSGALSRGQIGKLLSLSFWETEAFLKERQAYLSYDEGDFENDRRTLDRTLSERPLSPIPLL